VKISMDGRGRCQDKSFIERLWWAIKYHYLYLRSFDTGRALRQGLALSRLLQSATRAFFP
jgi:putative transposase